MENNTPITVPPFENMDFRMALMKDLMASRQNFSKILETLGVATQVDMDALQAAAGAYTYAYNIKDFGALPAPFDSSVPIRDAIAEARADGGAIYVPPGKFLSHQIKSPSNMTLMGQGFSSQLVLMDHAESDFIVNEDPDDGNENIRIFNLKIDGNKAHQEGEWHAIKLTGATDSTIDRVFVENASYASFSLKECARCFLTKIFSKNHRCVGAYFADTCDSQIIGMHSRTDTGGITGYHAVLLYNGSTDNHIIGLIVRNTGLSTGVTFYTGCDRNKLSQAILLGCGNGVEIVESDEFLIDGIYCDNARATSDYESGIEIVTSCFGTVSNAILKNNYAAGLYARAASNDNIYEKIISTLNGWSGFIVNASLRNKFAACKSIKNDGRGYFFQDGADDCGLTGSDALNNGQGGAYAGLEIHDSDYTKATGGVFSDDQTPKTQTYAVEETGTSDYSQIHGINASRNLTGDISLSGVNSVETDNMV